ncbi:MAG TPA: FAD-dependent oxidoreductase, partial [Kofleriaceae bacterium]|nr:FAD-dependent oxidoreductase [Kofleriaceae bacterium]
IVIGGGVGGLTVAHELVERGYTVEVYEARAAWGGKSRSQPVPGSATAGRRELPGEHGFRFYPRFYKHVIDTMSRIPSGGASVVERLRATTESAIALVDRATWYRFFRRSVSRPYEIVEALELFFQELDFDNRDVGLFAAKILQFLTSCDERRLGEYEHMSWWEYLHGDIYSENFQRQLRAVPRTMVAMDPRRGSARTVGTVSMQLIMDYADTGVTNDRTMGGPTSEMWIDPWVDYLHTKGVAFHANARCTNILVGAGQITGVELDGLGVRTADYYVLAVPIDAAIGLLNPQLAAIDPALARLAAANADDLVSWMTGIQYFLYEDVPLVRGHTFYPDSPWALTTISQPQFWRDLGLFRTRYGNGEVGGLISVDISDWDTPGNFINKPAKLCTPDEVAKEVWSQLKAGLNGHTRDEEVLTDAMLHSWHLDDDLDYSAGSPPRNHSRLLVHPPGSWNLRPEAATRVPNLVLAADYVRTQTDLASMEGACEAGRRATNAILERSGYPGARARLWPLTEPAVFARAKKLDAWFYKHGKRHLFERLGIKNAARGAAALYKLEVMLGWAKADEWLDKNFRATKTFRSILELIGFG